MRNFPLLSLVLLVGCNVDDSESVCEIHCTGGKLDGDSLVTPVDRDRGLRADWEPRDLVRLPNAYRTAAGNYLRLRAATAFIAMADAAYIAGHDLACGSTYRSFAAQCSLFGRYALEDGCEQAATDAERAGHSEHQLGTACDIYVDGDFLAADSPAAHWLDAHAHEYGFSLSTTGCQLEPRHWRYIGPQATNILRTRDIAPADVATIEADALERPEDVTLICAKCGDACFANPLSVGPDRCD